MSSAGKRKCRHCGKVYQPDPRNLRHQRHCSKAECRRARKRKSQRRWLCKSGNRDYFCGAEHVERVRAWRAAHPGYWRRGIETENALQDDCPSQGAENSEQSGKMATTALQDVLASQPLVLIGLIAQFTGITLQDEIALAGRRLLRLGQDIVGGTANETSTSPGTAATRAAPIQLGRSPPGS
jgi:hypothetical protein